MAHPRRELKFIFQIFFLIFFRNFFFPFFSPLTPSAPVFERSTADYRAVHRSLSDQSTAHWLITHLYIYTIKYY